jgi:hypothetical protein
MHTLAAAPPAQSMRPAAVLMAASSTAADMTTAMAEQQRCAAPNHGSCPDTERHGGHTGAMRQAPAIGGAALTAPQLPAAGPAPVLRIAPLPATTATEAADGTGCGPPSLDMLSISRT